MITLVGYMGSGKTTIGRLLAKRLDYEFIDLDELIEDKMEASISSIFKEHGEEGFRTIEINLLQYAIMKGEGRAVLSTGGGTPTQQGVMNYINQVSTSFYLNVSKENLISRLLKNKNNRPIIADKNLNELSLFINEHLSQREPFYALANFTIENNKVEHSVKKILSLYKGDKINNP